MQEEELDFCRGAGKRGPVTPRDEGPGETEGVSPGAICAAYLETKRPRTNSGPKFKGFMPLSFLLSLSLPKS